MSSTYIVPSAIVANLLSIYSLRALYSIILVLGPGARHVEHPGLCSNAWLETLAGLDTHPRLLAYTSEVRIDQDFEWSSLLKDGDRLLSALVKLCEQHRVSVHTLVNT